MAKAEWFRRTTWTSADEAEFRARLDRSRSPFRRAQYLRIQALHLHEMGTRALTQAALSLLDQMVTEWPNSMEFSLAQMQRAECLIDLARETDALDAYRAALDARRSSPHVGNDAHHGFAELIVRLRRDDLYDEALAALAEFARDEPFPVQQYRGAAARAIIADRRGDPATARTWARSALEAAGKTESPFRRHRRLGLVHDVDPDVLERLKELAIS